MVDVNRLVEELNAGTLIPVIVLVPVSEPEFIIICLLSISAS